MCWQTASEKKDEAWSALGQALDEAKQKVQAALDVRSTLTWAARRMEAIAALERSASAYVAWERAALEAGKTEDELKHGNKVFWRWQFAALQSL